MFPLIFWFAQHEFNEHTSAYGTTNQQDSLSFQTRASMPSRSKHASRTDAVAPVWSSAVGDHVNTDDFRVAVMNNDLKSIETFLKHGKFLTYWHR